VRQHLAIQRWRFNEDLLIKVGSYVFAMILWPFFAALELIWRIAAIFDHRRQ
jgi:hypothetical protein